MRKIHAYMLIVLIIIGLKGCTNKDQIYLELYITSITTRSGAGSNGIWDFELKQQSKRVSGRLDDFKYGDSTVVLFYHSDWIDMASYVQYQPVPDSTPDWFGIEKAILMLNSPQIQDTFFMDSRQIVKRKDREQYYRLSDGIKHYLYSKIPVNIRDEWEYGPFGKPEYVIVEPPEVEE